MAKTTTTPAVSPLAKKPQGGAAPGTPGPVVAGDAAAKADKPKRVPYRSAEDAPLLSEVPADYNRKQHMPLKKGDFADEAVYFEYRADLAEAQAKRFRREADDSRKLGNTKDRVKAKRLLAMLKRIDALKAELAADGSVDVEALMAAQTSDEPETVGAAE